MENRGEQRFNIQQTIEQKPFESQDYRRFFKEWMRIHDSIQPVYVWRKAWQERAGNILEKRRGNEQALYITRDLQLWEMAGVMEVVDRDTFAKKPELQKRSKEKILALGKDFKNAAVYIAQRLDSVSEGKSIASSLAEEFYQYGDSLISGKKSSEQVSNKDIAKHALTSEETVTADQFLAGDTLYASRQARVEKKIPDDSHRREELIEEDRRKALAKFFKASERAFRLKTKSEQGELQELSSYLKPWQQDPPVHTAFVAKVEKGIGQKIETPKIELVGTISRRGVEMLQKNIPSDKLPENFKAFLILAGW